MTCLLDTNICIAYLNGTDRKVRDRLLALSPEEVSLCSVVKAELIFGARHSAKVEENLRRLRAFFAPFSSLPFDDAAAEQYGILRAHLEREGRRIGANDMMIAAIAMASENVLITRDQADFFRVPGLRLEEW
ncbi:MAG TPA: type II toxin-antitoxin system VapC family toxin [Bdellovibrionota bacterium]|nr:type II toxin-antitoxin system VapC family toxin [Bdellovibrionota bacterium]